MLIRKSPILTRKKSDIPQNRRRPLPPVGATRRFRGRSIRGCSSGSPLRKGTGRGSLGAALPHSLRDERASHCLVSTRNADLRTHCPAPTEDGSSTAENRRDVGCCTPQVIANLDNGFMDAENVLPRHLRPLQNLGFIDKCWCRPDAMRRDFPSFS